MVVNDQTNFNDTSRVLLIHADGTMNPTTFLLFLSSKTPPIDQE